MQYSRILVTGATGLIGNNLVHLLAQGGARPIALVRDPERARPLLPGGVELRRGDLTDRASLKSAVQGMDLVFHAAGMPEQWQRDESIFDRVNRQGTRDLLEEALAAGVKRVVYTSTMDVFAAERGGGMNEDTLDPHPKHTAYERSKQAAEREAEAVRQRGLDVVYLNPSAVYGPSPVHVSLNTLFLQLLKREAPMLPPGGCSVVYVEGLGRAHLAAAERAKSGERFLLADEHVSVKTLAQEICRQAGLKTPPAAPAWLLRTLATVSAPPAKLFGIRPLVTHGQLDFLAWDARVDASKARRDLGFVPTPLAEGVRKTIEFLKAQPAPAGLRR